MDSMLNPIIDERGERRIPIVQRIQLDPRAAYLTVEGWQKAKREVARVADYRRESDHPLLSGP
ncbi:hypothetical protein D3C81_2271440 [compost metagenome]